MLKQYLRTILNYIYWTKTTMKHYAELFHTKPDNVFENHVKKLKKKIKKALKL